MNRWIMIIYVDLVEIHTAMLDTHIHVSGCADQNGLLGLLTTNRYWLLLFILFLLIICIVYCLR